MHLLTYLLTAYLEDLIADALAKGGTIANADAGGGQLRGALFTPAVLDQVTTKMRISSARSSTDYLPLTTYYLPLTTDH